MILKLAKTISTCALIGLISSLSMILTINTVSASELTVNVQGIKNTEGYLLVALYSGDESYSKSNASSKMRVNVNSEKEQITFKDIPDGKYAVTIIHDENDNKTLDKNMLGIPSEGYGFSNNKGRFGKPDYKDASFSVKDSTEIDINIL